MSTPRALTGQGVVNAEDLENLDEVDDDVLHASRDIHGAVLQRLGVRHKLVHVAGHPGDLLIREPEQGAEHGQVLVHDGLKLLQKLVQR